jgi:L-amino acid N-acyltransferase YncA
MALTLKNQQKIEIRALTPGDWEAVCAIYLDGIATGQATFETTTPTWQEWNFNHLPTARLVAISESNESGIRGWAALSRISTRLVYAAVAEVSVYVAKNCQGQGIGRVLLEQLVDESEKNGIWTLQASVFPENVASIALHKDCGFRQVGIREKIGRLNGVWRDTVLLERRSKLAGTQ